MALFTRFIFGLLFTIPPLSLGTGVSAYKWPSPQYDALEQFLYEGTDVAQKDVAVLTRNCVGRGFTAIESPIAAEWLRLAYHDVATHNITDGTGGIDASIFAELDRSENVGVGMVESVIDFAVSASKFVSRADIIALGAVWGVASCGGPVIPFRGGRKDAIAAGRFGVPEPQQDLSSHTESFRLQGFTPSEMIGLVACGHTFGSVRSSDFPDIVADPTGVKIAKFDTTDVFDHAIISEYLNSTTQDALVRPPNATFASDLRIFSSDKNKTMHSLNSATSFSQTCTTLLAKMLNTVPSAVTLTEEIVLLPAKVSNAQITVINSQLFFNAVLRLSRPIDSSTATKREVKMFWCDRRGEFKDCNSKIHVASLPDIQAGNTSPVMTVKKLAFTTYEFLVPIFANASVSTFWFEVNNLDGLPTLTYNNGGQGYLLPQDQIIYVPFLSDLDFDFSNNVFTTILTIAAGIRSESHPSRAFIHALDLTGQDLSTNLDTTVDLQLNSSRVLVEGYTFYSGVVRTTGAMTILDLEADIAGASFINGYLNTNFDQGALVAKNVSTISIINAPHHN